MCNRSLSDPMNSRPTRRFIVYGRPKCGWCEKAKALLKEKGEAFYYIDISLNQSAKDFIIGEGHKTVPQVYWKVPRGEPVHIGGYEQLAVFLDDPMGQREAPYGPEK